MVDGTAQRTLRVLALALFLASCGPADREPRVLEVLQVTPEAGATGVYLNERVQVFLSEALDPASVHARSARLVAADGTPARGRWEVSGARLTFTPEPVLARDLSDGGYRPGATYRVELVGFPRPDGLRGASGAPLARTSRWEFQVVDAGAPGSGLAFEDASLEVGLPLFLRDSRVEAGRPIVLEGEEPLDPSTVFDEDFVLALESPRRERIRIPVRAVLVENFERNAPDSLGTTRLELVPQGPLDPGARYLLSLGPEPRLRDFGGHLVALLDPSTGRRRVVIRVQESTVVAQDVHFEAFIDTENRSLEVVEGADGMARWGSSGRVEVRFPAAAGRGGDGEVALSGGTPARDVQAVRLLVSAGETVRLDPEPGLVLLRAQGMLRVEGRVERAAGGEVDFEPGETLSGWLTRMERAGSTATVLIAGGDLVVSGHIDVDGPLVLVAGGRVRLSSRDRIEAAGMYTLGAESSVEFLDTRDDTRDRAVKLDQAYGMTLDPPQDNPLAAPLIFAVRSGPIPRHGRALRWHASPRVGDHPGNGEVRVRFVGERRDRAVGEPGEVIVEDPAQLIDCPSLRLLVVLEVRPGEVWDPPWLDFVEVAWDRGDGEGPR